MDITRVEWGKMGHLGLNGSPTFFEELEENVGNYDKGGVSTV